MAQSPSVAAGPAQPASRAGAVQAAVCIALMLASVGAFVSPPVTSVTVALALVLALASAPLRMRLVQVARQPLCLGALTLLAVMTLAMAWAGTPWQARLAAWWNWRILLLIVLAAAAFGDVRWKFRYCLVLVGAAAAGALVSFVFWKLHIAKADDGPGIVLRNHVTQSMALAVAVVLGVVLAAGRSRRLWLRLALTAAVLLCLADLVIVTTGRSGQVALLVALIGGALMLLKGPSRVVALLAVPLLAAALTLASPMLQKRFRLVAQEAPLLDCAGSENSTGLRLLLWRTTGDLILERPWFGYGVGGFTPAFEGRVRSHLQGHDFVGWCARPVHDPHNQFLRVTVEAGVLGLAALLCLIAGAARQKASQPYRACALALLAAWCVTSLFNSHFQTFNEGHMIALLLGALLAPETPQPDSAANTAARTSS